MSIERRTKVYGGSDGTFECVVALDVAAKQPRAGILVIPNVLGQKESDNIRAERLAAMGYVGFVADLYGQGKRTTRERSEERRVGKECVSTCRSRWSPDH